MKKLPFLISVPHGGLNIPEEIKTQCQLNKRQIITDSDQYANEIYAFKEEVEYFISTDVARAIVDLNRKPDDFSRDGVIKTHTCYLEKVYHDYPAPDQIDMLLKTYYWPYHKELTELALKRPLIGLDCHTMAAISPPVSGRPNETRPWVCLSNADGTCPSNWMDTMVSAFKLYFGDENVKVNSPFKGGHIIRSHSKEIPWIQIEISRGPFLTVSEKRHNVLSALKLWCAV